jgi:DNA-binding NarL/FixJ family response regulator
MNTPIRMIIADDHHLVREGLRMFLSEEPDIEVIAEASNGAEAVTLAAKWQPDVVLMDLLMPEMDGIDATRRIKEQCPACNILALTSFADDQKVREVIKAGATGYLLKDVLRPELLRAIRAAAQGQPTLHPEAQRHLMRQMTQPAEPLPFDHLTERERDVLALIAEGHSNKEIAAKLSLTEGTVKGYVSAILLKLDVADRTQAALYAVRHGLTGAGNRG